MSSIFCFATGASTLAYKKELFPLCNRTTLAFGHAFLFFWNHLKYYPTYWTFVDAHSTITSLKNIIDKKEKVSTTLLLFGDITHVSLANFRRHGFGKPYRSSGYDFEKGGFKNYQKLLDQASKYLDIKQVPATSYIERYGTDNRNHEEKILALLRNKKKAALLHMRNFNRTDKLHTAVLPLCVYLGYNNIYLIGFDGKGGRFLDGGKVLKKVRQNDGVLTKSYQITGQIWKNIAKKLDINIYSMASSKHTVLTPYFKHIHPTAAYLRSTPFFSFENLRNIINGKKNSN